MLRSFLVAAAILAGIVPALAQTQKPYAAVPVTLPDETPKDPAYAAFRKELVRIVAARDRAALHGLILPGFFWARDFGGGFDRTRPVADNFERAVGLGPDGREFEGLAALIAHERIARDPVAKALCGPVTPRYDEAAFDRILEQTDSDGLDWAVPVRTGVALRAQPKPGAPVVGTLALTLVRGLEWFAEGTPPGPAWHKVAAPGGTVGFVASSDMLSLVEEKLCYAKGKDGRWGIAGYVGGGD